MKKFQSRARYLTWFIALLLSALVTSCGGSGGRDPILGIGNLGPAPPLDTTSPTVIFTVPADGDTGVVTNRKIIATFSEAMDPATILAPGAFTVCETAVLGGACVTPVAGTVDYDVNSRTAIFTPTPITLTDDSFFTATITTGATDQAGNPLAAGPVPNPWSFATGALTDATAPMVMSMNPDDLATGVCLQRSINATFDEDMDPRTLTTATFTLQVTAGPGPVLAGTVTYDAPSRVATLTMTDDLLPNTEYTATVTTGAEDLAGNPLAADVVWTFETGTQACLAPVALGAAAPLGTMGGGAGMTNTGTLTVINGDIASAATASTAVTGFHDSAGDVYTETLDNIGTVTGLIYTCTTSTTGPTSAAVNPDACTIAEQAAADAQTAFNTLAGLTPTGAIVANLSGEIVTPGVYAAPAGSFLIDGAFDLTLDAQGDANAVFVFQMASTLTVGGAALADSRSVILINGAQAKNVFWQVGSAATINPAGGGTMVGTIISSAGTSFSTAGNVDIVTLNGRAMSLNASVTLVNTVINVPAP